MITGKETQVLDRNSEYLGVSTSTLMEKAGQGVAEFIINQLKNRKANILVLCGTGNNGGDGFVAARYLITKYPVTVFLAGNEDDIKTDIASENFLRLKKTKAKIISINDSSDLDRVLSNHDVIVDAILGIGFSGTLREPYATIIKKINSQQDKTLISVDVPTGLGTDLSLHPQYTVTFHDIKEGMNQENSGEIHIVDIGIPKEAATHVGPGELFTYYPRPKKHSRKGDNGSVLVIGGGPYTGAPALVGMAALRTGADLAFIVTPKRVWQAVASYSPNLIVHNGSSNILTQDDVPLIKLLLPRCHTIIIGPGLGAAPETEQAIQDIIKLSVTEQKTLVLDADAIKPAGEHNELILHTKTVITPHAGEFKKLTGIQLPDDTDKRKQIVEQWAKKLDITILLKGPVDIISNGIQTRLNTTHNEAMTVGGTGDVLAGIVGALLSKGAEPINAAQIAAFLNGAAGNEAFAKQSYGLLATDIIDKIPTILKKYL